MSKMSAPRDLLGPPPIARTALLTLLLGSALSSCTASSVPVNATAETASAGGISVDTDAGVHLSRFIEDDGSRYQSLVSGRLSVLPGGCVGLSLPDGRVAQTVWPSGTALDRSERGIRSSDGTLVQYGDKFVADGVVRDSSTVNEDHRSSKVCNTQDVAYLTAHIP